MSELKNTVEKQEFPSRKEKIPDYEQKVKRLQLLEEIDDPENDAELQRLAWELDGEQEKIERLETNRTNSTGE